MPPYSRWTREEEELVIHLAGLRFSIEDIARIIGRSTRAIIARVLRLNTQGRLVIRRPNDEDDDDDDLPGGAPPQDPPPPPGHGNNGWDRLRNEWANRPNLDGFWLAARKIAAKMEGES